MERSLQSFRATHDQWRQGERWSVRAMGGVETDRESELERERERVREREERVLLRGDKILD